MKLLKRRTNAAGRADHALMRVAESILRRQRQVSEYLNRKTQYWNRTSKLMALFLFCLLFGGCCLLLLMKAIIHL